MATAVALVVAFLSFHPYVRSIVKDAVSDDEFIRSVARNVRPAVIFDSEGSILADQGAMQYISKLDVNKGVEDKKDNQGMTIYTMSISLLPKEHLSNPPLLQTIDPAIYFNIDERRGKGLEWIIKVRWQLTTEAKKPFRFRLEVIK